MSDIQVSHDVVLITHPSEPDHDECIFLNCQCGWELDLGETPNPYAAVMATCKHLGTLVPPNPPNYRPWHQDLSDPLP